MKNIIDIGLHRLLYSMNPGILRSSRVDGFKFYHTRENRPETVSEFLYRGHEVYDIIPKLAGDVAVDIGANIGCYTVRLAEKFGDVFAFEPNPQMFYLLKLNIRENHCERNTMINQAAVSDMDGRAVLRIPSSQPYGTTLEGVHYDWLWFDREMMIPTVTIDRFFFDTKLDFVKIDVEGHELAVLRGGRDTLRRDHPLIAVEIHRNVDGGHSLCKCPVCRYLRELGFSVEIREVAKGGGGGGNGVHWVIASDKT